MDQKKKKMLVGNRQQTLVPCAFVVLSLWIVEYKYDVAEI